MAKPMTKTQLVAALAEIMAADRKSAASALDAITGIITREVTGGGAVKGFYVTYVKDVA